MEAKKNPQVDLMSKSNIFFNIGLVISLLLVIIAFEWKSNVDTNLLEGGLVEDVITELVVIPPTIQEPPKPKVDPILIPVEKDEEVEDEIKVIIDVEFVDETVIEKLVFDDPVKEEKIEEAFRIVEQSAAFQGGMAGFYKYVGKNLKYPSQAQRMGLEGKIFIEFVIEKNGSISEVKILRGLGGGCNEEAIRVLENSPAWSPGKQRGIAVRQRMVLPITFKLR